MVVDSLPKDFVIPFPLDEKVVSAPQPLIYRPWGTRTIKLKVATRTGAPRLWIRPQAVLPQDAALGIYQAYADDSRALRITWGGGHERGPCVKAKDMVGAFENCAPLSADDTSFLYFNLTHAGPLMPRSTTATLKAFECLDTDGRTVERDYACLCLRIERPADLPPPDEIIRFVPAGGDGIWTTSPGRYLPAYDSRWWPSAGVTFEASERPPLIVRLEHGRLVVEWGSAGHVVAAIEDHTVPSVLLLAETISLELFAFDPWSIALRVWFFWVDKFVGPSSFVGRHEVPDAERFDMIIRRKDGRVLLAATDLHWREVWARVLPDKVLLGTLGVSRETAIKLAKEKWKDTWNEIWVRGRTHAEARVEAEHPTNPVEPFIRRLAEREATVTVKASGTEAHIPTLHNVEQRRPSVMTSSDVRLG